jgi:hypothetical protein
VGAFFFVPLNLTIAVLAFPFLGIHRRLVEGELATNRMTAGPNTSPRSG